LEQTSKELKQLKRFSEYKILRSNLVSELDSFRIILKVYQSGPNLKAELNKFITAHSTQINAFHLLGKLSSLDKGSLISSLIEFMKERGNDNHNKYVSSSNRILFEFYLSAYLLVMHSNNVLKIAYTMRNQISGESHDKDYEYCATEKSELTAIIMNSIKQANEMLSDDSSLRDYKKLMTYVNMSELKFMNVIQTFYEHESVLSQEKDTCWKTCPFYSSGSGGRSFHAVRCHGTLYSCERSEEYIITYLSVSSAN